ncbi:M16 family metallopeptidase [Wenxinia saemankumensis]|uniref:Zinc protease n=1 Tax=Wenxinia saemankumensis TaxID=1447782 RepID=A0A1M6DTZ6_9RHOB|nr:pitrilysin family protein [Wenxinia saemankumensis]SHI76645.1 zinc protease [Wenxinia saemankumensis]
MLRLALALSLLALAPAARAQIAIQTETSPGGVPFWLVEEDALPFIALEIFWKGGASLEPGEIRGATNLMMATLEEGSGDMDAQAFQAAREDLAASFGFDAYDDSVAVSARVLTENRDEALDLLRQAITDPAFAPADVDRVRGQVLAGLARDEVTPNRIAGDAFWSMAFPDHPYGSNMDGTVETVSALTPDDLRAVKDMVLTRERVSVGIVGDITAAEAGPMIDALLGGLPATAPPLPAAAEYALEGGVEVIPFETPQSVAIFGQPAPSRDDPDFFAAYVLNHILGGGSFESRLMDEVREQRGLTYGIGTNILNRDQADIWIGSVASANDRIAEAIEVTREVWADIAETGVTEAELEEAKTYLTGEYPLRFDGNGPIAEILAGMQYQGLPASYVTDRNSYIEAVTMADIRRVAAEWLDAEALQFVVVGQPEGLEEAE